MEDQQKIRDYLLDAIGEEGCGLVCEDADIIKDDEGWKLFLCGFMEPWKLGNSASEARDTIKELAQARFGLS